MKRGRIILMIVSVLLLAGFIIEIVFFLRWSSYRSSGDKKVSNESYLERYYKIVQITAKQDNILHEYTIITTKEGKVIDTRIVKTGYTTDKLVEECNTLRKSEDVIYNLIEGENDIKYNSSGDNGKQVDDVVKDYQNNEAFKVVTIRKI
ncbi:MAG: hypothetical protein PHP54_00460 [Clostridia bacterium]|nr:hypothetical protein [Clostridia bacterium]